MFNPPQLNRQLSVVIADDEPLMRTLLGRLLSKLGYRIAGIACDGLEAVEMSQTLQPDFLILDIKMPVMDGMDAARRILAARRVPIIVCSGAITLDIRDRVTQMGIRSILSKPFTLEQLIGALDRAGVMQEAVCSQ